MFLFRVLTIIVGTPFEYVSAHIIQTEFVGFLLPYHLCGSGRVGRVPTYFVDVVASCEQVMATLYAASGGIFPFRLGRQTEKVAVLQLSRCGQTVVEGGYKGKRIIVTDIVCGVTDAVSRF